MAEPSRTLLDEVADYVFYAPVGLVATVIEELPGLVKKGHERVATARVVGEFAVTMSRRRIEKAIADRRGGGAPGSEAGPAAGAASEGAEPSLRDIEPRAGGAAAASGAQPSRPSAARPGGRGSRELAIPGYDALAASQVVQRLAGLSPTELEAVRAYEESTRRRRTILGKIAQLTTGRAGPGSG